MCESLQSRPTPCDPMDCSLPGSSVHGILLARLLDGLPFPSLGDPPNLGINPASLTFPALIGRFFTTSATWKVPCLLLDLLIVGERALSSAFQ